MLPAGFALSPSSTTSPKALAFALDGLLLCGVFGSMVRTGVGDAELASTGRAGVVGTDGAGALPGRGGGGLSVAEIRRSRAMF